MSETNTPGAVEITARYRKKPVVIEAIRLPLPGENQQKVADLFDFLNPCEWEIGIDGLHIRTLEGSMRASPGDWIIKGVAGEFYPCKPDIFAATYEPAGAAQSPAPVSDADVERVARAIAIADGYSAEQMCGRLDVDGRWPVWHSYRDTARAAIAAMQAPATAPDDGERG